MTLVQQSSSKLRRSRRLSSTRGLTMEKKSLSSSSSSSDSEEYFENIKHDLNQKLGLCPIVSVQRSRNEAQEDKNKVKKTKIVLDRKLLSKEWDFNEKISLSSADSSPVIDLRQGFEISKKGDKKKLEFEKPKNKSIVQKLNSSRWYLNDDDENVIKSDSKYEIGVPAARKVEMEKLLKQKKISPEKYFDSSSRIKMSGTSSSTSSLKKVKKLDKTSNDSISKRLELIHELNQKILANYEKFQQKSKTRSYSKNSKDFKDVSRSFKKDLEFREASTSASAGSASASASAAVVRKPVKKLKELSEIVVSTHEKEEDKKRDDKINKKSIKIKNNPLILIEEDKTYDDYDDRDFVVKNNSALSETSKFTFSKEYCDKLVSKPCGKNNSDERIETKRRRIRSCSDKTTKIDKKLKQKTFRHNVNDNFILSKKLNYNRVTENLLTLNDDAEKNKFPKICTEVEIHENQESKNFHYDSKKDFRETVLEKRILDDFNRTINKFDTESNNNNLSIENEDSSISLEDSKKSQLCSSSFSSDSIKSVTSSLKIIKSSSNGEKNLNKSNDDNNKTLETSSFEPELFNSSWDSGVVIELCSSSGWVRVHTGIESSLVYLTLDTTAKDVCRDMILGQDLSIFIQYGGEPGRRLSLNEKPLELQDAFLQRLGYFEPSRRTRLGVDPELRHLVAFHVGPTAPVVELTGYSKCGFVLVLKGLVFPQWKRRPLAVIGSRLFLYPASSECSPEWIELGGNGSAVCCAPSRLGRLVLRVTGYPRITSPRSSESLHHPETRHLYLGFHHPWDRDLWRGWLKQATQHPSCPEILDLSKGGLSRIPESTIAFPAIEELLLGENQLGNPNNNLCILNRFPRLTSLHLQRNNFNNIPEELMELKALTILDLSDNQINEIPSDIKRLINLEEIIFDRNGLKDLPSEVGELKHLRIISVVGNLIEYLPHFLKMRALVLADVENRGNETQSKFYKDEKNNRNNLHKVNLRNNQLKGNIILGNYGNLTHLDVSENNIENLDLSALQGLRSVRCARNILTELTLSGRNLISLIAGNNRLKKLSVEPVPINLEHLDISYNSLDSLPDWTPELPLLRALFASNNSITALPDRLLSQSSRLEVLHLPHNRLQALPPPRRPLNLAHLTLQGNTLTALPENFFANTSKLKVLNLSNNRLTELPSVEDSTKTGQTSLSLEKLYLTGNCLTDTVLDSLSRLPALRVLHAAYNSLDTMPESCIAAWIDLEELVLSGNRLQYLPDNVANLQHLRVLRVHSNRLLTCPTFNKTNSLRVLDLAHNQLDRINLDSLVPPQLQFLDISCNSRLHVDPRQFQVYRSQRPLSLVDVSGQNRSSLPSHPHHQEMMVNSERSIEQPWRLGFSETAGGREKLFVSQIRMPSFCNVEGLFGVFDGGSNQEAPSCLQEMIPRILLEERTIKETSSDYLKYTLLSAHRELKEKGQKYGVDATLVHLTRIPSTPGYPRTSRRYALKISTSGEAKAVLCRAAGPLSLAPSKKSSSSSSSFKNQLGNAAMFPLVVPDPVSEEVLIEDDDEFLIIGNRRLWEVLSVQEAVREARAEASPVLAAKRLQDLAQAYGAEDNISVIVLRLTGQGSSGDLDQLMRELRHAVGKSRGQTEGNGCLCTCCQPHPHHKSPTPCCCHVNNGYYLNGVLKNIVNSRSSKLTHDSHHHPQSRMSKQNVPTISESDSIPPIGDDRSSPSGQSDQASDSTFKSRNLSGGIKWANQNTANNSSSSTSKSRQESSMNRKSNPAEVDDTVSERSGGALSEEQFRCWEYMLEQNTQLLFDKELDTLTRSPLRRGQSRSTPHLTGNLPFLSKRFGSARTFSPGIPRAPVRFGSGRRFLSGGPNAAYFGSLQRLMPYNLEYDFAVIQERAGLDSLEQDSSRMQQYWGVATTEL